MPKLIREKQWLLDSAITFNHYPTRKTENIEKSNTTNKRNQRRLKRQNKKREEIIYLYTTTETYKYGETKEMEKEQDRLCENTEKIADLMEKFKVKHNFSDRKSTRLNSSHTVISYAV